MDINLYALLLAGLSLILYGAQRITDQKRYAALFQKIQEDLKRVEEGVEDTPEEASPQTVKALYHLVGTLQSQSLSKDQLIADLLREKREMIAKLENKDRQINSLRVDMANCQEMIAKLGKFDDSTLP